VFLFLKKPIINILNKGDEMKYIITIIITAMLLFSCSGSAVNNAESDCQPKWFAMKDVSLIGKLLGKKDYKSRNGVIYGKGFDRAIDRNTAQELAQSNAKKMLLKEISEDVVNKLTSNYTETHKGRDIGYTKDIKRNLEISLERKCEMCFVEKMEDCYNSDLKMWDSYVLVELDFDNWTDDKFRQLLEGTSLTPKVEEDSNINQP